MLSNRLNFVLDCDVVMIHFCGFHNFRFLTELAHFSEWAVSDKLHSTIQWYPFDYSR